jgi:hypothetical protein
MKVTGDDYLKADELIRELLNARSLIERQGKVPWTWSSYVTQNWRLQLAGRGDDTYVFAGFKVTATGYAEFDERYEF